MDSCSSLNLSWAFIYVLVSTNQPHLLKNLEASSPLSGCRICWKVSAKSNAEILSFEISRPKLPRKFKKFSVTHSLFTELEVSATLRMTSMYRVETQIRKVPLSVFWSALLPATFPCLRIPAVAPCSRGFWVWWSSSYPPPAPSQPGSTGCLTVSVPTLFAYNCVICWWIL